MNRNTTIALGAIAGIGILYTLYQKFENSKNSDLLPALTEEETLKVIYLYIIILTLYHLLTICIKIYIL